MKTVNHMGRSYLLGLFVACVQLHALQQSKDGIFNSVNISGPMFSGCTADELDATRKLVAERRYGELRQSQCLDPASLRSMEIGDEDPDDAWEFLGCGSFYKGSWCNAPTSSCTKHQLPSVLYIGLPHAGSTSLSVEMNEHEELSYGSRKEHRFYASFGEHENSQCLQDYKQEFLVDCDVTRTFDATPNYLFLANKDAADCHGCYQYHWHTPGIDAIKKVKSQLGGDLRIMAMFRDPLDILRSSANLVKDGVPLQNKVTEQWRMCYADSVEIWLKVFPREQFLFLDADAFFHDAQATLDTVFDFVGVAPKKFSGQDLEASGRRRTAAVPFSDEYRRAFYADPVNKECKERLETLTGLQFNW